MNLSKRAETTAHLFNNMNVTQLNLNLHLIFEENGFNQFKKNGKRSMAFSYYELFFWVRFYFTCMCETLGVYTCCPGVVSNTKRSRIGCFIHVCAAREFVLEVKSGC